MNLFSSPKTSVAEVLKTFTQTLADLDEVATNNNTEATKQSEIAATATVAAKAASDEAVKASTVRSRLAAIVEVNPATA